MSERNGEEDLMEILRQAGGPQNLSPVATAQCFLLQAMLREERKNEERKEKMKGEFRSSKEFWEEATKQLKEPVERTIKEVDQHLVRIRQTIDRTCEDSYATRNDLRAELAQFQEFRARLAHASPGVVDLVTRVTDYGYDPEAAASDHMCGLDYVSDLQLATDTYKSALRLIDERVVDMERAGIEVKTGVMAVAPPEHDEFALGHEMDR